MFEPELLLAAYRQGIFPMAIGDRGEIGWFSPDPRAVIPLDDRFHVPHGLRRVLRKNRFCVTFDKAFGRVIRQCANRPEGTWISREIINGYTLLHRLGYAHSIEVWLPETELTGQPAAAPRARVPRSPARRIPAGGLYGVHLGGVFFGESMFHRETDASKVALVALVEHLRARGFTLLDTQWVTPHLAQFGTHEIPRREYLRHLKEALARDCRF